MLNKIVCEKCGEVFPLYQTQAKDGKLYARCPRCMHKNETDKEVELDDPDIIRCDIVHNAVFNMCRTLTGKEDLEWSMEYIGEIADLVADILTKRGHLVKYPSVVTEEDGSQHVQMYYGTETVNKPERDIGKCVVDNEGNIVELEREFFGQGDIFKSWDAYKNRPSDPCYVPETSDTVYTAEDFLKLCNGQKAFADELFETVDWQHPSSLKEDWMVAGEWVECKKCGKLVDFGCGITYEKCPNCGAEMEV